MIELLHRREMMGVQGGGYIQNGLAFHLDADDFNGGDWVDRIGGITYTNHGATKGANGAVVFNGVNQYLESGSFLDFDANIGTVEYVINYQNSRTAFQSGYGLAFYFAYEGVAIQWKTNVNNFQSNGMRCNLQSNVFNTISINYNIGLLNKVEYEPNSQFLRGWSSYQRNLIGYTGYASYYFKGEILQIRIYDRFLTKEEMLHNQQVDNERFNLGL